MLYTAFHGSELLSSYLSLENSGEFALWYLHMSAKDQASQFLLVKISIPWLFHPGRAKHVWHICWYSPIPSTPCQTPFITWKWPQHLQQLVKVGSRDIAWLSALQSVVWVELLTCAPIPPQQCLLNIPVQTQDWLTHNPVTLCSIFTAASLFYLCSVLVLLSF